MTTAEILYPLLRLALGTGTAGEAREALRSLPEDGWEDLVHLAGEQTVTGLLAGAFSILGETPGLPADLSGKLIVESVRIERRSQTVATEANALLRALEERGLHPVLMKGPSVAAYYPHPEWRTSGDVDLYLPEGEYDRAVDWFREHRFPGKAAPDGSWFFRAKPAGIDLHRHYYDLHVPEDKLPPVPSERGTLLLLTAHILKHAMGPGIGLRQLCDLAMAWKALQGAVDPETLRQDFDRAGIGAWSRVLAAFLRERLGVETGLDEAGYGALERIVFRGGDFGRYSHGREKALEGNPLRRKLDTVLRLTRGAPFGLRYAPREYFAYIRELAKGNA